MKELPVKEKRSIKQKRERSVLFGVVEHYIQTGKAVGSNTLKEAGFKNLSSSTIRNYFADLESEGYLHQAHISGGRIPTEKAFKLYAEELNKKAEAPKEASKKLKSFSDWQNKELTAFFQYAAETISSITGLAAIISAPRFDQDFVVDLKLVPIDSERAVCLIITDFGNVKAETVQTNFKLTSFAIKKIEEYFNFRLKGLDKPGHLTKEEKEFAESVYNEMMVRFVVSHSNFFQEDLTRVGFSKLLSLPDFHETTQLAASLALFENTMAMRLLLRECFKRNKTQFWIGEDLTSYTDAKPECAVILTPYHINTQAVGALGVLGPIRMPYKSLFGVLNEASSEISKTLTKTIFKFKITFRQPDLSFYRIARQEHKLISEYKPILLEDKRNDTMK